MAQEQHFIPQFYLRGFRDSRVPVNSGPWLWVADFGEKIVQLRSPKAVGKKTNYYTFPELEAAGGESIECIFSKLESAAAPVIKKLVLSDAGLEGQDRADLLFFMACFVVRVPSFRTMMEGFAAETAQMMLQMSASHPEYFERTMREALKEHGESLTAEQLEKQRQFILDDSRYTITTSPKLSIATGFEAALDTIYPIFDRMTWAIVRAGESLRYITSDTPVSWVDPTIPPPYSSGLAGRNVEVTFPLSPSVAVFGTWEGSSGSLEAKDRSVGQFNTRCFALADRYAFADSEEGARFALDGRQQMERTPAQ